MIRANYYDVEEVTICPYCGTEVATDPHMGCCGEVHSETAYLYQDEIYMADEIEIYKPVLDMIRYEVRRRLRRSYWLNVRRKLRSKVCRWYDGHDSLCLKLRRLSGFRWTKLDCIILKQLHDFPLYYTSPKVRQQQREKNILEIVSKWERDGAKHVDLVPRITDSERDKALFILGIK